MGLEFDVTVVEKSLMKFAEESEKAISTLVKTDALVLQSYAQEHRPWTDRTGHARQRLKGTANHPEKHLWEITLAHGVDYGIWLECAHERKYAIIQPTIQAKSPEVMESFENLIENLSFQLR